MKNPNAELQAGIAPSLDDMLAHVRQLDLQTLSPPKQDDLLDLLEHLRKVVDEQHQENLKLAASLRERAAQLQERETYHARTVKAAQAVVAAHGASERQGKGFWFRRTSDKL